MLNFQIFYKYLLPITNIRELYFYHHQFTQQIKGKRAFEFYTGISYFLNFK